MPVMPRTARREEARGTVFNALASQQRRAILVRLSRGAASTPEIASQLGFTKQALSRHLTVLEGAGLIVRSVRVQTDHLALVPSRLDDAARWIVDISRGWHKGLDRLGHILRGKKRD